MFKDIIPTGYRTRTNRVDGMMITVNRRKLKNNQIVREVVIRLNKGAVSSLRLKDKDRIILAYCDETNCFAVRKSESGHGFLLSGQDANENMVTSQRTCPLALDEAIGFEKHERYKALFRVVQDDRRNEMVIFERCV